MRKPRTLVPIPRQLAAVIDKVAGPKQRATFIVNLVEREIRRLEQRDALREAAGSWKDEDHPELAEGADKWVQQMRQESGKRFEKIEHQREAEWMAATRSGSRGVGETRTIPSWPRARTSGSSRCARNRASGLKRSSISGKLNRWPL